MGVKKRTSEYQHAFKSVYPSFTPTYENNVDYRTNRRLNEHNHQVDPFDWDPSESSSESGLSIPNGKTKTTKTRRPPSVPLHIYKHEKFNKNYRDQLDRLAKELAQNVQVSTSKEALVQHAEDEVADEEIPLSARSRDSGVQTDKVIQVDRAVNGTVQVYPRESYNAEALEYPGEKVVKPQKPTVPASRPSRPAHKPSTSSPPPRASSAPPAKSTSKKHTPAPKPSTRPPFVSYGCRDKERSVTTKLTYNVRASAEVHPSAVLAKKRRQLELAAKKQRLVKSTSITDGKKRPYYDEFNARVKRETTDWDTEYRSHFPIYNRDVYQQSLSRPQTRMHDPQLLVTTW